MWFALGSFLVALPLTLLTVAVVLGITLLVALRVGKHAVVDVAWGLGFAAIALVSFLASAGTDQVLRRLLLLVMTAAWGIRLGTHIAMRSRGKGEDPRYTEMLSKAPGSRTAYAVRKIYLTQGAAMWFVSLPVQVGMFEGHGLGALMVLGVLLWAVGFYFETVGDLQLTRFRADPSTDGTVLDTGLWRYTRHPNYFGDACVWWGIALVAFSAWPGILTILSPVLMTYFLAKGTGKALLEKDIGERRPGYADYVRRTSGFIPMPPKKSASS